MMMAVSIGFLGGKGDQRSQSNDNVLCVVLSNVKCHIDE